MKKNNFIISIFFLMVQFFSFINCSNSSFVHTIKGVGHDFKVASHAIESAGKAIPHVWEGIKRSFGASPEGYIYNFTVQNDCKVPVYVGLQKFGSAMGATFPLAHGWKSTLVEPLAVYTVDSNPDNKYYFELSVNATNKEPSNHMPYMNKDALIVQDCIQLPQKKNSTQMNYFRSYMGKDLKQGRYIHSLKAEYLGYADPSNPKDKGASIKLGLDIDSLVIYNSTYQDLFVGYSSQRDLKKLTKNDCDVFFAPVEHDSFALFNPSENNPLIIGSVGVFAKDSDEAIDVFSLPAKVFAGKKYTLEIYQDDGKEISIDLQGLMPGNYDVAAGRVRDITPVTLIFWYQSVQQYNQNNKKPTSGVDLPGQVWMIAQGGDIEFTEQIKLSQSLQFRFFRPVIGAEQWFYFVYVDTNNEEKGAQFAKHFAQGLIGKDIVDTFREQSEKQVKLAQKHLATTLDLNKNQQASQGVPEDLLIQALQGSLKINRGKIVDNVTGLSGYLIGADKFLPQGVGSSSPFYYQLGPSMKTQDHVPMAAVQNEYSYTLGSGKGPKGMPAPSKKLGVKQHMPVVNEAKVAEGLQQVKQAKSSKIGRTAKFASKVMNLFKGNKKGTIQSPS